MKLTDKIHLLRIDFEITISPDKKLPRFVNVLIIFGDKITLIDTGVKESETKISEYIRQNGRDFSEIETVILSHSHPDHIGSAAIIKELTGCRIKAHRAESEWIESLGLQNRQRPVPGFFNLADRAVKVDEFLEDREELHPAEGLTLKIIHSPGHSEGSLNILFVEDKILFTADSVPLINDIPNYDNYPDLRKSLHAIRTNKNYATLLSSWTPPLTDPSEIKRILDEGEAYMKRIDEAVRGYFTEDETDSTDSCKRILEKLGLPLFLANPLVNKAFRSHMI